MAIEVCDGVLVHSCSATSSPENPGGGAHARDLGADREYFAPKTVVQSGYPLDMRYSGPREALLHAVSDRLRCAYQILGRDHAGVGATTAHSDAHRIFRRNPADALEIRPMRSTGRSGATSAAGWPRRDLPARGQASAAGLRTKLRKWLSEGGEVPAELSRRSAPILREYYEGLEAHQRVRGEAIRAFRPLILRGTPGRHSFNAASGQD